MGKRSIVGIIVLVMCLSAAASCLAQATQATASPAASPALAPAAPPSFYPVATGPRPMPQPWVQNYVLFGPLLVLLVLVGFAAPYAILIGFIAQRKGQNVLLWVIISLIPVINMLLGLWLVSMTDKAVLDRLAAMSAEIQALKSAPPGGSITVKV